MNPKSESITRGTWKVKLLTYKMNPKSESINLQDEPESESIKLQEEPEKWKY